MAIRVEVRPLGPVGANCYVLVDGASGEAAVIDPGAPDEWILRQLGEHRLRYILLTHAHFDHIGGVRWLKEATGAPVLIHEAEVRWLQDPRLNGSALWPDVAGLITAPDPDVVLGDGDALPFASTTIRVVHTPGHSPGSVSLLVGDLCFSGDALFHRGIGRTDLPFADHDQLLASIRERLFVLPDATRVYPGHGPATTIGEERRLNPFVGESA